MNNDEYDDKTTIQVSEHKTCMGKLRNLLEEGVEILKILQQATIVPDLPSEETTDE
jgi:hypothetical protein